MAGAAKREPRGNGSAGGLSDRGWGNVEAIMPKIAAAVSERSKMDNPSIDLASAENWLLRPELAEMCREAVNDRLRAVDFSYPRAFAGFPEVLTAFAALFNDRFEPRVPVEESHLATAPGAASCLDTFLYNVCDPGEGVLVPSPYWSGFDFQFKARSSAVPIAVPVQPLARTMTLDLIPALERELAAATVPVRALLVTNPQNPLGQRYPAEVLAACMRFCQQHDLHYISDEVYALTAFRARDHHLPDAPPPPPFVSALSFDLDALGVEGRRVHAFWSTSKDLGQSGFRMGCSISQFNREMAVGLALASNTQTSSLASIFVSSLLTSPRLSDLLALNGERLAANYEMVTDLLRRHSVEFLPSYAGLYLYARVVTGKAPESITWEDEAAVVARAKSAGVLISAGRGYHGHESERGWARIGFALDGTTMREACERLDEVFGAQSTSSRP